MLLIVMTKLTMKTWILIRFTSLMRSKNMHTMSRHYVTQVTDDSKGSRCLYYLPFQGVLKLVRTGKRGEVQIRCLGTRIKIGQESSLRNHLDIDQTFICYLRTI